MELAENIRALRKDRRITQQQLADAMNVTVGAVHKWEQGLSTPDIRVILELAGFFGISVDALVGYRMEPRDKSQILDQLKSIRLNKNYRDAWDRVEGWLRQYPNDFDIVCESGILYHLAGVETGEPGQLNRAIELLKHAANLMTSPSDAALTELYQRIGLACLDLGRREEGLGLLKAHNPCGVHNDILGMELAQEPEDSQEAKVLLSRAFFRCLIALQHIGSGFFTLFSREGDYGQARALVRLWGDCMEGLETGPSFLTKDLAVFRTQEAAMAEKLGDPDARDALLEEARSIAERFDSAPDYSPRNIRFCGFMEPVSTFDDAGATAREAVRNAWEDCHEP